MNIQELIASGQNVTIPVTPADLKEFAGQEAHGQGCGTAIRRNVVYPVEMEQGKLPVSCRTNREETILLAKPD